MRECGESLTCIPLQSGPNPVETNQLENYLGHHIQNVLGHSFHKALESNRPFLLEHTTWHLHLVAQDVLNYRHHGNQQEQDLAQLL